MVQPDEVTITKLNILFLITSVFIIYGVDKVRKNLSANSDSESLTAKVGFIKQHDTEAWTNVKYVRLLLFLVSLYYLF